MRCGTHLTRLFTAALLLLCIGIAAAPGAVRADEGQNAPSLQATPPESAREESASRDTATTSSRAKPALLGTAVAPTSELASRGSKAFIYGLTAFFIGIAFYKKFGDRAVAKLKGDETITILSKKQLSPKHQLFLVRVRGKEVLLGAAPDGLTTVATFDEQQDRSPFDKELAVALHDPHGAPDSRLGRLGTFPAEQEKVRSAG